jgi:hypothetical protein
MSEFHQSQEMEGSSPFAFSKDQASVVRCSAGLLAIDGLVRQVL